MAEDLDPPTGKIRLKITCPLSPVTELIANCVDIPALQGVRRIIPGQAPLFCRLNAGKVVIYSDNHSPITYVISRGVAEVRRDICAIMAWAIRPEEVHPVKVQALLEDASNALPHMSSKVARQELQNRIDFYRSLLPHT